jgi:UDP-N-acetylglucosamine 4,6-dehydratase/5-epimerase
MDDNESSSFDWSQKSVLVTGGTGSFGRKFVELLLKEHPPKRLIVYSRDELKQDEMRHMFPDDLQRSSSPMRYFIGDVRDVDRLRRAMNGVNVVVHAAALKQVPTCEYNPIEAVMTNVMGARNVIEAALDAKVDRTIGISTDKAVNPVNLYGGTKLVAEKLFVHANVYSGLGPSQFSCVRYGNVVGSRGSVIPLFQKQRASGKLTLTDPQMTRFWLTLQQGVRFVIKCITTMRGGEVFVPKIPSMKMSDLANAIAPGCTQECVGIRAGEKIHEVLISEDEAHNVLDQGDMYVVKPSMVAFYDGYTENGPKLKRGFKYSSDTNEVWLDAEELLRLVNSH